LRTRPGLDRRTRSIVNLAMLGALNRPHELKLHVKGALKNGLTKDEIKEILLRSPSIAACQPVSTPFEMPGKPSGSWKTSDSATSSAMNRKLNDGWMAWQARYAPIGNHGATSFALGRPGICLGAGRQRNIGLRCIIVLEGASVADNKNLNEKQPGEKPEESTITTWATSAAS